MQGRIEMLGRRGRRRKQLLDDFKEERGYGKLKEEILELYKELTLAEALVLS
jgi:1-aminocyclopropane-1-carboxylate deaminase/D-cysteine desulfhydrase-like pyridoxal-dependent ACC family enzyme